MMQTHHNNHNDTTAQATQPNNEQQPQAPVLLGDCARALVAAGLTSDQAGHLPYARLIELTKLPTLVAVAHHFLVTLIAVVPPVVVVEEEAPPPLPFELNVKWLLTMYLIVLHPTKVFARRQNASERALSAAAAPLLDTFSALVVFIASATADDDDHHQLPLELTAPLLRQLGEFKTAFAVWKAIDTPRLVGRLCYSLASLRQARATAAIENKNEVCLQIDVLVAQIRRTLASLQGGVEALALLDHDDAHDDHDAAPQAA